MIPKNKRSKLFIILSATFWIGVFIALKVAKFNFWDNPIYTLVMIVIMIGFLIVYQRRETKLKKERQEIRKQNVEIRKKKDRLSLDPKHIPIELQHLKEQAEKWGQKDALIRDDLFNNSSREELVILKECIEKDLESLQEYLEGSQETNEYSAIKNTHEAYEELGLWTWEK